MAELKPKLRFTNGYDIDLTQTARLIIRISGPGNPIRARSDLLDELGLPDRQVTCLTGIAEAMGLIMGRSLKLTYLGRILLEKDPYLSTPNVPWIVHYNLASNPELIIWFRMANEIVWPNVSVSIDEAKARFADVREVYARESAIYFGKEIRSFFRAYTEGALSSLAYLAVEDDRFICPSMLRVPPIAFAYSLFSFSRSYRAGETAIDIGEITAAPSSPGRIFLMREADVRAHLERMHRNGVVSIENKGHLDQVRFVNPPDPADYLRAHFEDSED